MAWRQEMDYYVFGQRFMTNIGIALGNGMAYYALMTLAEELDQCSFGPPGSRSVLFGDFNGDVTSCRNSVYKEFEMYPTGGKSELQGVVATFLLVQIILAGMLIVFDLIHQNLHLLSPVTFMSLIMSVTFWATLLCYPWMLGIIIQGLSVTCHESTVAWKSSLSHVRNYAQPTSCASIWLFKGQGTSSSSFVQYVPFNMAFLVVLGFCLGMLFHILGTALLLPQTWRWVKQFRETYHIALNPVYRIRRPGEEEDF